LARLFTPFYSQYILLQTSTETYEDLLNRQKFEASLEKHYTNI